ncbi:hypothetical protein LTR36_004205 [Oleoguttula mirabilis]|uniref:BTB domain-containing protein n=1 Tax=Oleoguttula mirabilis TaxID=1507867 RepID=A0AAV9JHM1_9PEZI|nr:hypothetical protein LTR36_004205 [Oleoguttula mirabilis]
MGSPSTTWSQTLSHYNPLHHHYRRNANNPPVYSRDFAYANNAPVVLAPPMRAERASISGTSAQAFAEYVHLSLLQLHFYSSTTFVGGGPRMDGAFPGHAESLPVVLHKRLLSGPTVDIYVGPERRHWSLHRNLLCHHSSYFETEFQGHEVPKGGKKDGDNTLELPDDDPRGFELLVKWLYQGLLEDVSLESDEKKYDYAVACHKLYMLCDNFDMISLKNVAMDLYRRGLNEAQLVPDADEINEIYRASPPTSPFRKLMVKIAARQIMDPEVQKDAESYRKCFEDNADFAIEMVNAIRSMSGGMLFDDPTEKDECQYHDHRDGSKCLAKGKAKAKVEADTNGAGPPSPAAVGRKALPAELSAERRTPRKLDVRQQPSSPTPKPQQRRHPGVKAHVHSKLNGLPPSSAEERQKLATDGAKQAPAQMNGLSSQPAGAMDERKQAPAQSVLGKRRTGNSAVNGNTGNPPSAANAPSKPSNVNGIVQQLNGVDGVGSSDESQSQSQGGANEALPLRKAAPKLRKSSVNGA